MYKSQGTVKNSVIESSTKPTNCVDDGVSHSTKRTSSIKFSAYSMPRAMEGPVKKYLSVARKSIDRVVTRE